MGKNPDVILVGCGHNNLIAGAYMAKAGLNVLGFDKNPIVGGDCKNIERSGYVMDIHSTDHVLIQANPCITDLELDKYGYVLYQEREYPTSGYVGPNGDWMGMYLGNDFEDGVNRTAKSIEEHYTKADANGWREIMKIFSNIEPGTDAAFLSPPIPFEDQVAEFAKTSEGKQLLYYQMRTAEDVCDEFFVSEGVKCFIGNSIYQFGMAPHTSCSGMWVFNIMGHFQRHGCGKPVGGSAMLPLALKKYIEAHGGNIMVNSYVKEIIIKHGKAVGVKLDNGAEYFCEKAVVTATYPGLTVELVGEKNLSKEFIHGAMNYKWKPSAGAHVSIPLRGQINFGHEQLNNATSLMNGDRMINFKNNENCCSKGEIPKGADVIFWWTNFSVRMCEKAKRAPKGCASFTDYACDMPYRLASGDSWDLHRDEMYKTLIEATARYAPNIRQIIDYSVEPIIYTPADLPKWSPTNQYGDPMGGRMTFDQVNYCRPFPGYSDYRVHEVKGLYMNSASTWPGGGVTGMSGYISAGEICDDLKVKKWWLED